MIPTFNINTKIAIKVTNIAFNIGVKYSVLELFYMLYYNLTNVWKGDDTVKTSVCSNFVAWWFNKVAGKFKKPYSYSPQRIFDEAEINGFKIVKIEL